MEILTPRKIDELAKRRSELELREEKLNKEFEAVDAEILTCIDAQGELAERSSKTRTVTGREWELRATVGEETKIDQKVAKEFCEAAGPSFAAKVFRREEKLVLIQTPDRLEGGADLPIATRRLFQAAVQIKPRSPRVEVRSRLAAKSA